MLGRSTFAQNKPEEFEISIMGDQEQFTNPAVPVVVVRTVSGLSEPDADSKRQYLAKQVILENRSTKDIASVTLRWAISPMNSRTTRLTQGEFGPYSLSALHKTLLAGQRQTLKLVHPKFNRLIDGIQNRQAMGNRFRFIIGVAEVSFEDGSTWKEESTDVGNKKYFYKLNITHRTCFSSGPHSPLKYCHFQFRSLRPTAIRHSARSCWTRTEMRRELLNASPMMILLP
jgi:hypothetical protein